MHLTHLTCTLCGQKHDARVPQNVSACCGKPLFAAYDLVAAARTLTRESLRTREKSIWRYREVLPVRDAASIVTLGEGWTPLLPAPRLAAKNGLAQVFIKDEAQNPTGSFKARGMTAAVSMAKEFGLTKLAVPSAGNAAGALAAYAARAGLEAHIFMPRDTPRANLVECEQTGAHVTLIDGLITDCGAEVAKRKAAAGWFDVSTLKEPYRAEGKKTLGYEVAEQLGWKLPDVILYPTGGGTGLIGMWKAFSEMEELGLLPRGTKRPRMYTVQADGCQPIVRAFHAGEKFAAEHLGAQTRASGLRVPKAIGDFIMLDALRTSGGGAVAIPDADMISATREVGAAEGIFPAPEGAACYAALKTLVAAGQIRPEETVVIFNTGTGLKYLECY
ncbi:MAG: threonine synthase [Opitutia bacterium Tous-C1TDCM]|nr:MAG: threonine synthase [Opitutae bacterium Tous-C1TDCM]